MKIGNISQTVLKRSVLKQLHAHREEALWSPTVEETCSGIEVKDGRSVVISSTAIYGDEKDLGHYGIAKAVNDVASRGGKPIGVEIVIQLPPYAYESRLKTMVSYMEETCHKYEMQILGIQATVCPVIRSSMVHVTAIGALDKDDVLQSSSAKPDMDILLLNGVGTEGALRILNMSEEKIKERFIPSFFQGLSKCREELVVIEPIQMALEAGAIAIHQLGEGGILASLWELGEAAGVGLELDLKKMIIRQDVIEICEFSGVNPYQLSATGSVLIVAEDGDLLKEKLEEKGYLCEVIGKTTGRNERVIFNGEEKRYLDRPTQGELQKLYENKGELHA